MPWAGSSCEIQLLLTTKSGLRERPEVRSRVQIDGLTHGRFSFLIGAAGLAQRAAWVVWALSVQLASTAIIKRWPTSRGAIRAGSQRAQPQAAAAPSKDP